MSTHITGQHRHAFKALTSGAYSHFAPFFCFVGGAPGTVNVYPPAKADGEPEYAMRLPFASPTAGTTITDHDCHEA